MMTIDNKDPNAGFLKKLGNLFKETQLALKNVVDTISNTERVTSLIQEERAKREKMLITENAENKTIPKKPQDLRAKENNTNQKQ